MNGEKFSGIGSFETEETRRIHDIDADLIRETDDLGLENKQQSANQPEQEEVLNTRNGLEVHVAKRVAALEAHNVQLRKEIAEREQGAENDSSRARIRQHNTRILEPSILHS